MIRGDSHYGRPEAMTWCERNRVGYIFGLAGNKALLRRVTAEAADSDEAGHAFQSEAGHLFRREAGQRSDLKPATPGVEPLGQGND
jgi:hypothetical protein